MNALSFDASHPTRSPGAPNVLLTPPSEMTPGLSAGLPTREALFGAAPGGVCRDGEGNCDCDEAGAAATKGASAADGQSASGSVTSHRYISSEKR